MEKNIWKETEQKKMRSMLRSEPEKFVDEILKCDHWGNSAVRFSCGAVYYAVRVVIKSRGPGIFPGY